MKKLLLVLALFSSATILSVKLEEGATEKQRKAAQDLIRDIEQKTALFIKCNKWVRPENVQKLHQAIVDIGEYSEWDIKRLASTNEDAEHLWQCVVKK